MILIPLIFGLILLAIGFGVGFWLIITAMKQDKRWLKILGSIFGWILISTAALITLTGIILGITFWRTGNMMSGCPMCQHMRMNQQYDGYYKGWDDQDNWHYENKNYNKNKHKQNQDNNQNRNWHNN